MPYPTVRDIVMYTLPDKSRRPAIVLAVDERGEVLDLEVFGPAYDHEPFPTGVRFGEGGEPIPGTWGY